MNKVRVEVFYQDNALQSIRIDKCEMEGLTAIENKPIPEWFMPVSGRASWKGLGEEVKLQTRNAGPDTQYSYYFYGPDMPKSVFAYCVQQYGLGEMVAETSKEDNAQVYLESAQRCEKVCDEEGAFQAYKAAAEKYDSAEAQLRLGLCYAEGKGNEKNMVEAAKWYRKAAEQGNADAQNRLGVRYDRGEGVSKDVKEAAKWYAKSAAQGHPKAQCNLALDYKTGKGVEKDLKKAVELFYNSAIQGYANAQSNLGECYYNGEGVEQDHAEAFKWMKKAAEQGDADAQSVVGDMYSDGDSANIIFIWQRLLRASTRTSTSKIHRIILRPFIALTVSRTVGHSTGILLKDTRIVFKRARCASASSLCMAVNCRRLSLSIPGRVWSPFLTDYPLQRFCR